jgi:uncharacterized protein (TIGR03067 family)
MCGLLATTLMTAWLHGDEPVQTLDGRWIVTKLVIDRKTLSLSKPPESLWFDVDGDAWRYSFVVDGKRVTARFKTTLFKNDTEILVDAKLLNGFGKGGVCKGICRIDGDIAQLCISDKPGVARPSRFECPRNSELQFFELRREEESPSP